MTDGRVQYDRVHMHCTLSESESIHPYMSRNDQIHSDNHMCRRLIQSSPIFTPGPVCPQHHRPHAALRARGPRGAAELGRRHRHCTNSPVQARRMLRMGTRPWLRRGAGARLGRAMGLSLRRCEEPEPVLRPDLPPQCGPTTGHEVWHPHTCARERAAG